MKPGAAAIIAERIRSHNNARPFYTVEEAAGVWYWKVLDPRIRSPHGGPVVVAEGTAETKGHGYELGHAATIRATAPRR